METTLKLLTVLIYLLSLFLKTITRVCGAIAIVFLLLAVVTGKPKS